MTDSASAGTNAPSPEPLGWTRWALLACFVLSGVAGLVYQLVWARQLAFVFGSSEYALVAVLAAFLGGLGLGASIAARCVASVRFPVLWYAGLELVIAASALLMPWGLQLTERIYVHLFGGGTTMPDAGGLATTAFDVAATFALLLVPTTCMGATLPLLARFAVRTSDEIGRLTGLLYAANTAGAVVGAPLAAFLLLPTLGLGRTVFVAAGLNVTAAAIALVIGRGSSTRVAPASTTAANPRLDRRTRILATVVIASGATSLTYEVVWTRLLAHLLGGSLPAFAIMLASFLGGLAVGAAVAGPLATTPSRSATGLAFTQIGIAVGTLGSWFAIGAGHTLLSSSRTGRSTEMVLVAVAAMVPAAFFAGATFPFSVRLLAIRPEDAGPASARIYAWSTVGSIIGSLLTGLVLLPIIGFGPTIGAAVAVNFVLAAAAGAILERPAVGPMIAAAVGLAALAVWPPPTPWTVVRSGPLAPEPLGGSTVHYAVGRSATVLLTASEGAWSLTTNGLPEGTIEPAARPFGGYQVTNWLGALPVLMRPETRSMMVVGLGAGGVLETVPSTVGTIDVVELEREVVRANEVVGPLRRRDPLADPRTRVSINDARAALLLSGAEFDAIVSQPSHPWTSGSAHLYTRELFTLVRDRLAPGGVFVQWIGLPFIDPPLLRSVLATLNDVFPFVETYRPPTGAALLFVASDRPFDPLATVPRSLPAARALPELGISRLEDVIAARVLDAKGTKRLAGDAPLVTDDHNLLESRAFRVLGHGLGRDLADGMLSPWDPLVEADGSAATNAIDRVALVRRLLDTGQRPRARRLAEATVDPVRRQIASALVLFADGDVDLAARLIHDAVSRASDDPEARAAFLLFHRGPVARGQPLERRLEPLSELESAVVQGWRYSVQGNTEAMTALEPRLARARPGEPLERAALRLRALWRVHSTDPGSVVEALEIVNSALARGRQPEDLALWSRAAAVTGETGAAIAGLSALTRVAYRSPSRDRWLDVARRILDTVPEDDETSDWRSSLDRSLADAVGQP